MHGCSGERQIGQKIDDIEIKHVERYKFAQKYCKDKTVLDAACGCGYGSYILSHDAKSVLGVDYSQEAIEYAKKNWHAKNINFRQFDLDSSNFKKLGNFDVIVSLETIEHLDVPIRGTFKKFYEILCPRGLLIISHPENEKSPSNEGNSLEEYIKKILVYIRKGDIQGLLRRVREVLTKKFRGMSDGRVKQKTIGFHIHSNIKGVSVKKNLTDIGFEIKDEWYQSGRFYYPYHLIVGKKK